MRGSHPIGVMGSHHSSNDPCTADSGRGWHAGDLRLMTHRRSLHRLIPDSSGQDPPSHCDGPGQGQDCSLAPRLSCRAACPLTGGSPDAMGALRAGMSMHLPGTTSPSHVSRCRFSLPPCRRSTVTAGSCRNSGPVETRYRSSRAGLRATSDACTSPAGATAGIHGCSAPNFDEALRRHLRVASGQCDRRRHDLRLGKPIRSGTTGSKRPQKSIARSVEPSRSRFCLYRVI